MTPRRTATILCLANSRKHSGRCVAGKRISHGASGPWLRPISDRPHGELSEEEMRYVDGQCPKLLDILTIPLRSDAPSSYQTENALIDPSFYWVREGAIGLLGVLAFADHVPRDLWINGFSSAHGRNDRIPESRAHSLSSSLLLVAPEGMSIRVGLEGPAQKRKVRGEFFLNARPYQLTVTDPAVESAFLAKPDGLYPLGECLLTVSLSSLYEGFVYKLIAGILTDAPP